MYDGAARAVEAPVGERISWMQVFDSFPQSRSIGLCPTGRPREGATGLSFREGIELQIKGLVSTRHAGIANAHMLIDSKRAWRCT